VAAWEGRGLRDKQPSPCRQRASDIGSPSPTPAIHTARPQGGATAFPRASLSHAYDPASGRAGFGGSGDDDGGAGAAPADPVPAPPPPAPAAAAGGIPPPDAPPLKAAGRAGGGGSSGGGDGGGGRGGRAQLPPGVTAPRSGGLRIFPRQGRAIMFWWGPMLGWCRRDGSAPPSRGVCLHVAAAVLQR
jgi:hypothetical protein